MLLMHLFVLSCMRYFYLPLGFMGGLWLVIMEFSGLFIEIFVCSLYFVRIVLFGGRKTPLCTSI